MDRTVDSNKQTGPPSDLGVQPTDEPKDDPLKITDAQGVAHRGSIIFRTNWAPELGCLNERTGEEFRIVILSEPPSQGTLTPECGVAVCAPDAPTQPTRRIREAGVACRARAGADPDDGEPGPTLAPEHAAALSRGQLLAYPTLDLSARDVFPPEEHSPQLIFLGEALLAQRAAEPYLRVLAAALTAPASPPRCERAGLLAALEGLLRDARAKSGPSGEGRRRAPLAAQALDAVAQAAQATSLAELAETARRLYPQPAGLGEDVYLCRALVERTR